MIKMNGITLRRLITIVGLILSFSTAYGRTQHTIKEPIIPLPQYSPSNPLKVKLGDQLFHDVRLSRDNSISCAHCHNLTTNGSDSRARSIGVNGAIGNIRAPTVYNSGYNFVQFWNGRAANLEEQAKDPITNPIEMGSKWPQVLEKLKSDPQLLSTFYGVYEDGVTEVNILNAIAAFEQTLTTTNAPFDRWLLGESSALSPLELKGYKLFKNYGCTSCHQGKNVGGNMYGYMGAVGNYFSDRGGELTIADLGRLEVTGKEQDRHLFKVPSLRLVTLQKFFFHDASTNELSKAIQIMGQYQLGRDIPKGDVTAIIAFLKSLLGEHPRLVLP